MGGNLPFVPGVYNTQNTIAEMILKAGQSRAQLQQDASQSLAGTVQQLGQIPGQIQRQRQQEAQIARETQQAASQKALTDRQTAEYQRAGQERDTLDTAMAGQGQPGWNPEAIAAKLPGHMRTAFLEQVSKANEAADKADSAKADYFGRLAAGVEPYLKSSDGGVGAATIALQHAKARGYNVDPILAKIQADPTQLPTVIQGFIASSPTMSKEKREENKPVSIGAKGIYIPGTGETIGGGPEPITPQQAATNAAAADRLAEEKRHNLAAEGKAKEPKWTPAEDVNGNPILMDTASGAVKPFPAGAVPKAGTQEANKITAAKDALEASAEIRDYLKKPEVKAAIGPIMGRYNSLLDAAGAGNPAAKELVGKLKGYAALMPSVHSFRAVKFADQINEFLTSKQTPEALIAGLDGIDSAARIIKDRGRSGTQDDPLGIR